MDSERTDVLDAMIFDFDGVVVDSEPVHLACFRRVLAPLGVELTADAYYGKYLGYDDHDCFTAALHDNGLEYSQGQIAEMIAAKTKMVQKAFGKSIQPLAGAVELIRSAAEAGVPLAVCSGGLRAEIELAARCVGVVEHFMWIVSAEDVRHGKPDPEGYRLALRQLVEATGRPLAESRCVVVEDSPAGIQAAKTAGMRVLAVTNSYPPEALQAADRIVESLAEVTVASLESLTSPA